MGESPATIYSTSRIFVQKKTSTFKCPDHMLVGDGEGFAGTAMVILRDVPYPAPKDVIGASA